MVVADLLVIGNGIVPASIALSAVQSGLDCVWFRAGAGYTKPSLPPSRLVSPLLLPLLTQRTLPGWPKRIAANWREVDGAGLWRRRRDTRFLLEHMRWRAGGGSRDRWRTIAALSARSLSILRQASPDIGSHVEAPMLLAIQDAPTVGEPATVDIGTMASEIGIKCSPGVQRINPADRSVRMVWQLEDCWQVRNLDALTDLVEAAFVRLGGTHIAEPYVTAEYRGDSWHVETPSASVSAPSLAVTSEDVARMLAPDLMNRLGLGKLGIGSQHFSRLVEKRWPVVDARGAFFAVDTPRGVLVQTMPSIALGPRTVEKAFHRIVDRALTGSIGEPRDLAEIAEVTLAPDMLPIVDTVPGKPGLWVALAFGMQDATLAPAAAQYLVSLIRGASSEGFRALFGIERLTATKRPAGGEPKPDQTS
jgi:glycine/D-amino acid oxidase-like deaminating enzyme